MKNLLRNILFLLAAIGLIIAVGCAVDDNGSNDSSTGTIGLTGIDNTSSSESSNDGIGLTSSDASSEAVSSTSSVASSDGESSSNPFGGTSSISNPYLTAEVYDITVKNGTATTDNFSDNPIEGAAKLYSKSINVPIRAYTDGFPGVQDKEEYFGVKYTGKIIAPVDGAYTFLIVCDDGVSMKLDSTDLSFVKISRGDAYWESAYNFCDDPAKAQGFRESAGYPWLYDSKGTATLTDDVGQYLQKNVGAKMNTEHPAGMYMATITLKAGTGYDFLLKYFQGPKVQIACTLKVVMPGAANSELFNIDNFK